MNGDDIIINNEIVLIGAVLEDEWCQWLGGGCFSSLMVLDALSKFDGPATIRLNSGGGDPFEGEAIRAAIAAHPHRTTLVIAGVAASAASLLAMGADVIEMSEGSLMMIHEPSSITVGQADDHRETAEYLDKLSDTYASVYARRSNLTTDDVRERMRSDWWMGPDEAIALGFADAVLKGGDAEDGDRGMHARALATMNKAAKHFKDHPAAQQMGFTGREAKKPKAAIGGETTESNMPPEIKPVETPAPTPAPQPAPPTMEVDEDAIREAAIQSERKRQKDIREMAAPHIASGLLMSADVDAIVEAGHTPERAGSIMLSKISAEDDTPAQPRQSASITRDSVDTQVEGMVGALMHRAAPRQHAIEGPAKDYRSMGLKALAMHLSGDRGYNDREMVKKGLMATTMMGGAYGISDFTYITTEVMNRLLRSDYERRPATWRRISRQRSASDFREILSVRFGGDFSLQAVGENGEYKQSVLGDEAEGLKVTKFGRTLNLTFEAIVNDDLNAFERLPGEMARAASSLESKTVWGIIRSNAVLKSDNVALFHANHKNLAGSGGAISVTTVGAARKAMWEQKPFGATDKDEFIEVEPNLLFVPPALETVALQFTLATVPTKDDETNPWKTKLEPVVEARLGASAGTGGSDTAWYLISEDLPPVEHAYLEGYESPMVEAKSGMNPDGVTMNARHIFGASAVEFRGAYKNAGA